MSRAYNILFIIFVTLVMIGALGRIPDFNGGISGGKSILEGRTYQQLPSIDPDAFLNGSLQTDMEQFIADRAPFRDNALIINAERQHLLIEVANVLFGFDSTPTYFGSNYFFSNSEQAIMRKPVSASEKLKKELSACADGFGQLINKHPDINWCFYFIATSSASLASPVHDLIPNVVDYNYYMENFLEKLPKTCQIIDGEANHTESYAEAFFRTDHHWRMETAVGAYGEIANCLSFSPLENLEYHTVAQNQFYGSSARNGLCFREAGDSVQDVIIGDESDDLTIMKGSNEVSAEFLSKTLDDPSYIYSSETPFDNIYAEVFHESPSGIVSITNDNAASAKTLLIIGDSYSWCFERLFAESYRRVYSIDPRSYKAGITSFLEHHEVDDCVIVLSNSTLSREDILTHL